VKKESAKRFKKATTKHTNIDENKKEKKISILDIGETK
tara:strand:- start:407 stop:520 length:114 start_codon:yes stop_codon:yes gene_type:complete